MYRKHKILPMKTGQDLMLLLHCLGSNFIYLFASSTNTRNSGTHEEKNFLYASQ